MPRSKERLSEGSHVICLPDTIIGEQEPPRLEPPSPPRRSHTRGRGASNYRMVQARHSPVLTVPPTRLIFHEARGVSCERRPHGASVRSMLGHRNPNPNETSSEVLVHSPSSGYCFKIHLATLSFDWDGNLHLVIIDREGFTIVIVFIVLC